MKIFKLTLINIEKASSKDIQGVLYLEKLKYQPIIIRAESVERAKEIIKIVASIAALKIDKNKSTPNISAFWSNQSYVTCEEFPNSEYEQNGEEQILEPQWLDKEFKNKN